MAKREQILVGLDIGTTKICAIVSEVTEEGALIAVFAKGWSSISRARLNRSRRPSRKRN